VIQQEKTDGHQSPAAIRGEVFSHRMRGLDEEEVREYLDMLADQIESTEAERSRLQAEIENLRGQNRRLREELDSGEISPQAVALFSQAQQVADQLVEEAVISARDLMMSARLQQRDILEQARQKAEEAVRRTGQLATGSVLDAPSTGYRTPIPEVEYVRTFAEVARVQLRSVLDALSEQVDRLDGLPQLDQDDLGRTGLHFEPQTLALRGTSGPFSGG